MMRHHFTLTRQLERMASVLLVALMLTCCISVSFEAPPKLEKCRQLRKLKEGETGVIHTFQAGSACISEILLPLALTETVQFTDPRNCDNYYKCTYNTCFQCPCPDGELFDPKKNICVPRLEASPCQCAETTTTSTTTTTTATPLTKGESNTKAHQAADSGNSAGSDEVSNGIIIIAVIVSATVIILLFLIIGFFMWQKGIFVLRHKPQMVPSNNDAYLHTLPTQERHVYAEIDERMISDSQNTGRTAATSMAGGPPSYLSSTSPAAQPGSHQPACIHHPHQTFTLPQSYLQNQRAYHISEAGALYSSCPIQAIPQNQGSREDNPNSTHYDGDSTSVTSCSGCSHCSGLSGQTQLENSDNIDRRNLLRCSPPTHLPPVLPQWNYVSKHVYI